jgi:hypothetical protein
MFKGVMTFFGPAGEAAEPIGEAALDRKWEALWPRVAGKDQPPTLAHDVKPTGFWFHPRALFALAASLVVALGVMSFWALRLRNETRELARQLQAVQTTSTDQMKALEQERQRLQQQASAMQHNYESQLAQLRLPSVNAPIYDLMPRGSVPRSGGENETHRIQVPATVRNVVMILHRDDDRIYPSYAVEIVNPQGQLQWRGEGLQPTSDGGFVITFDRTFLSSGTHRLNLYGQSGGRARKIAEYVVLVQ